LISAKRYSGLGFVPKRIIIPSGQVISQAEWTLVVIACSGKANGINWPVGSAFLAGCCRRNLLK
jgi:hypothetical protein